MATLRSTVLACAVVAALGLACAQAPSAWTVSGAGEGIYTVAAAGGLLLFCPGGDAPPDADVGPYGLTPGTEYALTFEVDGRDALRLMARVGTATVVSLFGDDAAALVAFLRDAPTTTVTMALAGLRVPGGPLTFELATAGLEAALAELPCDPR